MHPKRFFKGILASEKNLCNNSLREIVFDPRNWHCFWWFLGLPLAEKQGVVNLGSETPENLVNVTKVNLISVVLNAEKIKEIG